jgi:hypothetical protein
MNIESSFLSMGTSSGLALPIGSAASQDEDRRKGTLVNHVLGTGLSAS